MVYILLFSINSHKALNAIEKSMDLLIRLLPIFILIIVLTALMNRFIKPALIMRHIGKDSGLKGWMIALAGGVFSHGPMYVWYLLIEDLKEKGLRDGLIAAFFYARSIKVPLLPLMIDYFGVKFTFFLSFYIIIGAWIQGLIIELMMNNRKVKDEKSAMEMKK